MFPPSSDALLFSQSRIQAPANYPRHPMQEVCPTATTKTRQQEVANKSYEQLPLVPDSNSSMEGEQ